MTEQAKFALKHKRFADAIVLCDLLIGEDRYNSQFYFLKAVSQYHLGLYDESKRSFEFAQRLDPGNPEIKYYISQLKNIIGIDDES